MTDGNYILDSNGNPVVEEDLLTWAKWLEDAAYNGKRRVDETMIGDIRVSTVFLGLDHSFGGGPPLIFETMVFGGELNQEMDRYSTKTQALKGHQLMCERVKKANESQ
ncbi:hypothetical protein LCGC14_1614530 [marine sediment metagenome]|uniref:Uncharacterized protein n=1 Tax=marine sediment metagenome TaxID=412755 RepID=A0A0F9KMU7_9ZZZZ